MNISDDKSCFKSFCISYMYHSILMFSCLVSLKNYLFCNKIHAVFDTNAAVPILFHSELTAHIFYPNSKYESNTNTTKQK